MSDHGFYCSKRWWTWGQIGTLKRANHFHLAPVQSDHNCRHINRLFNNLVQFNLSWFNQHHSSHLLIYKHWCAWSHDDIFILKTYLFLFYLGCILKVFKHTFRKYSGKIEDTLSKYSVQDTFDEDCYWSSFFVCIITCALPQGKWGGQVSNFLVSSSFSV